MYELYDPNLENTFSDYFWFLKCIKEIAIISVLKRWFTTTGLPQTCVCLKAACSVADELVLISSKGSNLGVIYFELLKVTHVLLTCI